MVKMEFCGGGGPQSSASADNRQAELSGAHTNVDDGMITYLHDELSLQRSLICFVFHTLQKAHIGIWTCFFAV